VFSGGRVGVLVKLGTALASAPGGRKRTRGRRSIPTSSRLRLAAAPLPSCLHTLFAISGPGAATRVCKWKLDP
jgi:hypothetical protein